MRERLRRTRSTTLAAYVAVVDAGIWLAALPLELWWRTLVTTGHPATLVLLGILLGNLLLLAVLASGAAATFELVRRGFTRPVPALVRRQRPARSRRSVR